MSGSGNENKRGNSNRVRPINPSLTDHSAASSSSSSSSSGSSGNTNASRRNSSSSSRRTRIVEEKFLFVKLPSGRTVKYWVPHSFNIGESDRELTKSDTIGPTIAC